MPIVVSAAAVLSVVSAVPSVVRVLVAVDGQPVARLALSGGTRRLLVPPGALLVRAARAPSGDAGRPQELERYAVARAGAAVQVRLDFPD